MCQNNSACHRNLLEECKSVLKVLGLGLDDVTVLVNGEVVVDFGVLDVVYDFGFGCVVFPDVVLVVDDFTWFERRSFGGCEGFVLKAHPLLSDFRDLNLYSHL